MSPTGSNDIDLVFDPKSIIEGFRKIDRARADMDKGVAGATEKWNTAFTSFSEQIIKVSQRANQAQQRYVKSIEQTAAAYGKTGTEKLIAQRDAIIKRLGDEEKLVNRVRTAYDKMIEVEKKRGQGGHGMGGSPGVTMLRGARDLFEGRTAYGEVMMARGLSSLSGLPLLLGSTAALFGGVMIASYKAAESVGKYAQEVHDLSITTGLSNREVQQFQFAAKVTGQDISVLDRMTRGLTQAIEDEGSQGQKARTVLQGMGVDILALRSGAIGSGELFSQISSALSAQPNLWVRNKEAIELFKRAGISSLPMLMELNESLQKTSGINFMSDEQLNAARKTRQEIELVKTELDQVMLRLKMLVAKPFTIFLHMVNDAKVPGLSGVTQEDLDSTRGRGRTVKRYTLTKYGRLIFNRSQYMEGEDTFASQIRDSIGKSDLSISRVGRPGLEMKSRSDYLSQLRNTDSEAAENEASRLKHIFDETRNDVTKTKDQIIAARVEYEKQKDIAKSLSQSESDRLSAARALVELKKTAAETAEHPYGMSPSERALLGFSKLPGANSAHARIEDARQALLPERMNEIREMLRKNGLQMNPDGTISRDALQLKATNAFGFDSHGEMLPEEKLRVASLHRDMEMQIRDNEEKGKAFIKAGEGVLNASAHGAQSSSIFRAQSSLLMSPDTIAARLDAERQIAAARIQFADDTYDREKAKIADEYMDKTVRETAYQELRMKHENEVADIQQETAMKHLEEMRRQFDALKGQTETLVHTLFTSPRSFGKQFGSTMRDATLKPVESGIATLISRSLYTTVFSGSGTGGINGALSSVVPVNGAVPVFVVGSGPSVSGAGGGMSGGGFGSMGGMPGFGGLGSVGGIIGGLGGGLMSDTSGMVMSGAPGGSGGGGGSVGPTSSGGGVGGLFGGLFGGGGGRGGGIGGFFGGGGKFNLSALKSGFWNENINMGGYTRAAGSMGIGGKFAGVLTSPMAASLMIAGGTPLAMAGLMGNRRGTFGGLAESIGGGALVGAGIGTMILPGMGTLIGAGIGAAAGGLMSLGEMIAGVESPRNHAKKLVQSMYGITINNAVADSIVALAKQSYGNQISVAVRSPEVRQMLGLYAAGTGQRMPQSAMTPHGASLSNSGGALSQNPVYQYGNPYTYQSSLPVAGGQSTGSLPSPGGPTYLSLNVSGDNVGSFMTGRYVTPELIQSQYSAALQASKGRLDTALMFSQPGTIVA